MNNCCEGYHSIQRCVMQCPPACPSPHVPKLESLVCPKLCICGDQRAYDEDRQYLLTRTKYRLSGSNSLGKPIGLIKTNLIKSDIAGYDVSNQRFATYLKAFAYLFLSPEYEWNVGVLNLILKEGQKLISESRKSEELKEIESEEKKETTMNKVAKPSLIYSEYETRVKRSFDLLGSYFDVELSEKFGANEVASQNISDVMSVSLTVANLKRALKTYFKHRNYCLIEINNWYMFLWKANGVYFVLDVCGRRLDTFELDKDGGFVVLMCLKSLENIYHLVANLSGFQSTDVCNLREMRIIRMGGPNGAFQTPEYGDRENEFVIVSPDYAYLTSALHLTLKTQYPLRSRSALPVGVAGLIASKIDHPATWTENVLNKIICYGVNVCRYCWEQCLQNTETIDFDCFPNQFRMGQFLISFNLKPLQYTGIWKCVPNYQQTDLLLALTKFFESGVNNLLIQINQQVYAVWKKNDFIYLLDPYRHKINAMSLDGPRSATLRIFRTLDVFLDVFNLILLQSNRTSKFFIHTVQIRKIELVEKKDGVSVAEEAAGDDAEVRSLNEAICFIEDDKKCLEELGQPSDDEEEDSLEEEEIPESEPEPEVLGEEEGGGGIEDFGEVESSSDDGGIDDRRNNKNRGMDSRKKRKGGDKKKKNKRDMSERNKKQKDNTNKESIKELAAPDNSTKDETSKIDTIKKNDTTKNYSTKNDSNKGDVNRGNSSQGEINKGYIGKGNANQGEINKGDTNKSDNNKGDVSKSDANKDNANKGDASKLGDNKSEAHKTDFNKGDVTKADSLKENTTKNENLKMDASIINPMKEDTIINNPAKRNEILKNFDSEPSKSNTIKVDETNIHTTTNNTQYNTQNAKTKPDISREHDKSFKNIDNGRPKTGWTKTKEEEFKETLVKTVKDYSKGEKIQKLDIGLYKDFGIGTHRNLCKIGDLFKCPGYSEIAYDIAIAASENGSYDSICKLLRTGFEYADRVLAMCPYGSFVVFRYKALCKKKYFLFDGCTCNINKFRHMDIKCGTEGLISFKNLHDTINYMIDTRKVRSSLTKSRKHMIDEICQKFCTQKPNLTCSMNILQSKNS